MREYAVVFLLVSAAVMFVVSILGGGNLINGRPFFHPDAYTVKTNECQCERGIE
jgi:hypothetical protein